MWSGNDINGLFFLLYLPKLWEGQVLNSKNLEVISMCEVLEHRIITHDLPYDLEEPADEKEITRGLMRLSQQALSKYVDKEPDLY
jgi:hypothetical protein